MASGELHPVIRHLHRLCARLDTAVSDAQLVERFVRRGDEAAFELLIWRHGAMVLGVCRRLLGDWHDAEDAFQATLLVLARKARSIGKRSSVGSWLYKVAYRVSLRARAGARRRARHEQQVEEMPQAVDPRAAAIPARRELRAVLDDELNRLPEKYREPLVLCYLEGLTNESAARQLGCPVGTLKTRLAYARRLLGRRFVKRGVTLGTAIAAGPLSAPLLAALPAGLVRSTVRAALLKGGQVTAGGAVSAPVADLMKGVLRSMMVTKLKLVGATLTVSLGLAGLVIVEGQRGPALAAVATRDSAPQVEDAAARVEKLKKQIAGLQEDLRRAEKALADKRRPAPPAGKTRAKDAIAIIFGDIAITRAELGEHLIARMIRDDLDSYINQRILLHACRSRGITVTDQEVEAAFEEEKKTWSQQGEAFENVLLRRSHKSILTWKQDVIRPRLLMKKLCGDRITVTDQDLRQAYDASYGEKVEIRLILWPKGQRKQAEALHESIRRNEAEFDRAAREQPTRALAASAGRVPPLGRHSGDEILERAVFRLSPGEISPLIDLADGTVVVKCIQRIPTDTSKRFEDVRESLRHEVRERFLQKEISRFFQELKAQARPQVLWTPEAGKAPTPR